MNKPRRIPDSELVHCRECQLSMHSILDASIRHTCHECGGQALTEPSDEARERIRDRYRAEQDDLRAARLAERVGT